MSNSLFLIFASITVVFLLLLVIKAVGKFRFCVLCASVGLTWITLLILYRLDFFDNPVLIALLIGNSVVGIYYLVERKVPEKFHVFRLPFFLTLLFIGYLLLSVPDISQVILTAALLVFLWLVFGFLYAYGHNSKLKSAVSYVINCCKNW